jgi:N-carbamoylputrescine amidase
MASSGRTFKIGAVQLAMTDDIEANTARALDGIREAAARGAQLIVLPELFRSLYFCQTEDHARFALAESIPGPTQQRVAAVAKELAVVVVASLFERRAAGLYHNTAVVIDADGSTAGLYRKMHIPDDPLYYEKFYFTPGDLGFNAFDTQVARVGTLVCWDQWYPEAARLTALAGAEVLCYPTAIGWHPAEKGPHGAAQADAWRTIQRSHAIANGMYVVAVNRVGHEATPGGQGAGIEFFGGSFICDPSGAVLAEAGREEAEVLVVAADMAQGESTRQHWPFLRDRRIDAYGGLTQRYLYKA